MPVARNHPHWTTTLIRSAVVTVLLGRASSAPGQPPPLLTAGASVVAAEAFTSVLGVTELPDGRLVVLDGGDGLVLLVDLDKGAASPVARTGRGPNEYLRPFGPLRLPGDTVAAYDPGNRRILRIAPDGRPAGTVPIPPALYEGRSVSVPKGADAAGFLYFETLRTAHGPPLPATGQIIRWRPGTVTFDSVASLLVRDREGRRILAPFVTRDGWAVGAAGLVVVRADPYRVERYDAGQDPRVGAPVRVTALPLRDDEIDAYWTSLDARGAGRARLEGGSGRAGRRRGDREAWVYPEHLPPFDAAAGVFVTPSGNVWVVRRGRWNDSVAVVDVFGSDGAHVQTGVLPPHRRLVGVGAGVLYLVRVDDDDLEWLERYRLER